MEVSWEVLIQLHANELRAWAVLLLGCSAFYHIHCICLQFFPLEHNDINQFRNAFQFDSFTLTRKALNSRFIALQSKHTCRPNALCLFMLIPWTTFSQMPLSCIIMNNHKTFEIITSVSVLNVHSGERLARWDWKGLAWNMLQSAQKLKYRA